MPRKRKKIAWIRPDLDSEMNKPRGTARTRTYAVVASWSSRLNYKGKVKEVFRSYGGRWDRESEGLGAMFVVWSYGADREMAITVAKRLLNIPGVGAIVVDSLGDVVWGTEGD